MKRRPFSKVWTLETVQKIKREFLNHEIKRLRKP